MGNNPSEDRLAVTSPRYGTILEKVCEVLWALALICLPITTFPLFSAPTNALVSPLSILPFSFLLLIWGLPFILRKGKIPRESLPILVFALVVIFSCALAFFTLIPGFKGKSIAGQEVRALFTLAVGLTFYLVTTTWVKDTNILRKSWKYITFGGIISLAWTGVQAFYIFRHYDQYPHWLVQVQSWIAILSPSFMAKTGRVSGLTYEASWFAHQMVLVYLPIWMAASFHRTSAFRFRLFGISAENVLLVFGLGAFFLSSPRIGLVSLFLMVFYFFLRVNLAGHRRIVENISKRNFYLAWKSSFFKKTAIRVIPGLLIILVYGLIFIGALYIVSQRDWRLSILVSEPPSTQEIIGLLTLDQSILLQLSHRFIFLERMVYWLNGWNIFTQHPWFGVGLGNAGFFFPKLAPALGWSSYEIRNVLYYMVQLPNVKSLWFRLLAETGLVGFSVFLTWFYILFQSSRFSQHHHDSSIKTFALAGQLSLLAFIGEGFSIDSFAMPYLWVIAGLIAAIAVIVRRKYPNMDKNIDQPSDVTMVE